MLEKESKEKLTLQSHDFDGLFLKLLISNSGIFSTNKIKHELKTKFNCNKLN